MNRNRNCQSKWQAQCNMVTQVNASANAHVNVAEEGQQMNEEHPICPSLNLTAQRRRVDDLTEEEEEEASTAGAAGGADSV